LKLGLLSDVVVTNNVDDIVDVYVQNLGVTDFIYPSVLPLPYDIVTPYAFKNCDPDLDDCDNCQVVQFTNNSENYLREFPLNESRPPLTVWETTSVFLNRQRASDPNAIDGRCLPRLFYWRWQNQLLEVDEGVECDRVNLDDEFFCILPTKTSLTTSIEKR